MTAPTLSHLSLSLGYALLTIQIFQVSRFILLLFLSLLYLSIFLRKCVNSEFLPAGNFFLRPGGQGRFTFPDFSFFFENLNFSRTLYLRYAPFFFCATAKTTVHFFKTKQLIGRVSYFSPSQCDKETLSDTCNQCALSIYVYVFVDVGKVCQ